jgi:PBP1b-binding outer membrane lipoprotein LpoB
MKTILILLAAALLAGGCDKQSYPKDDAQAARYAKDEQVCRSQVRQVAQSERNVEDQRRATFDGERERFGQQGLYNTMANQGYVNNFDRLMANCMEARGWPPKRTSPFPKLSW